MSITTRRSGYELATNRVLQNTYRLLSLTLAFAAAVALLVNYFNLPHPAYFAAASLGVSAMVGSLMTIGVWFLLLFMIERNRNSAKALVWVFAFAGFTGYMAGALIDMYLKFLPNGYEIVGSALLTTAIVFFASSLYIRATGKDLQGMGKWLFLGILVVFVLGLVSLIFGISGMGLLVSAAFTVLMTLLIAYQTSEIIHGRETNYISATVTLYVAIYNLFTSLLHLFGLFGDE